MDCRDQYPCNPFFVFPLKKCFPLFSRKKVERQLHGFRKIANAEMTNNIVQFIFQLIVLFICFIGITITAKNLYDCNEG